VPHQIALRALQGGPERLCQVRHLYAFAVEQREDAVLLPALQVDELIEQRSHVLAAEAGSRAARRRWARRLRLRPEGRFANDLRSGFVIPESQIHGMTQLAVVRPFRELDL